MVLRSDKEKVKTLLSETIRLLCKNGLHFKSEFCVEALVGITLDQEEEFFLSIKETVKSDLVSSTKEHLQQEHKPKKLREHIKGEPSFSPSGSKKRPSETVTSEGEGGEIGSLTLGDMQEGEQSFWSSVTEGEGGGTSGSGGGGGGHTGGTPFKKRHIETPDDSSSSNPHAAAVKGEPDTDSDIEEVASTSGDNTHMAQMGDSFAFGSQAPTTSSSGYGQNMSHQSAIPPQVWDQLPPFSSLPGTSGIQSATNTVTSPDGQQQMMVTGSDGRGSFARAPGNVNCFQVNSVKLSQRQPALHHAHDESHLMFYEDAHAKKLGSKFDTEDEQIIRNILMSKGKVVVPWEVSMRIRGKKKVHEVVKVMQMLNDEGLGDLLDLSGSWGGKCRWLFVKKRRDAILDVLMKFRISISQYESRYNVNVIEHEHIYKKLGIDQTNAYGETVVTLD